MGSGTKYVSTVTTTALSATPAIGEAVITVTTANIVNLAGNATGGTVRLAACNAATQITFGACTPPALGTTVNSWTSCNGVMGFFSDFLDNGGNPANQGNGLCNFRSKRKGIS